MTAASLAATLQVRGHDKVMEPYRVLTAYTPLFRYLDKPGFSWERDGGALLRKHKPWCFGAEPLPAVTPLSSELAGALPSSR